MVCWWAIPFSHGLEAGADTIFLSKGGGGAEYKFKDFNHVNCLFEKIILSYDFFSLVVLKGTEEMLHFSL